MSIGLYQKEEAGVVQSILVISFTTESNIKDKQIRVKACEKFIIKISSP